MENRNKPAFSVTVKDNGNASHPVAMGLTKREYFAGLAMQGLMACSEITASRKEIAEESVKRADALLKALETKSE